MGDWRYLVIGNFKTVDESIAPSSVCDHLEYVSDVFNGVNTVNFRAIIDDFIQRLNAESWDCVKVIHDFGGVIVIDGAQTQQYDQFQREMSYMFSHAVISKRHLDLFLFFQNGGTVEEFEAQGGDLSEIDGSGVAMYYPTVGERVLN